MIAEANNISPCGKCAFAAVMVITARINNPSGVGGYIIATTRFKYLINLPPASQITRPLVLTNRQPWSTYNAPFQVIVNSGTPFVVGDAGTYLSGARSSEALTITITEGSEDYITPAGLMTTILTTATEMTMVAITTTITNILYRTETITIGLPTTNIGAADMDSRQPPSFPPPSPTMPKLAFATIPRAQLLSFPLGRE